MRHNDIRPQLIATAEAERATLRVQYGRSQLSRGSERRWLTTIDHPDEPGPGKYNVTSYYPEHLHWGPDRDDRPDILFAWEEDKETNPRRKCPGPMYWEEGGRKYVVLDPHDNPVKDWDIPSTIASNIPGYKLEAMRRQNMSLGHKDCKYLDYRYILPLADLFKVWARMPSRINGDELAHPNSSVNMPMERFRFHAGLTSWTERQKTLTIKAGLRKLYGDKLQNNSVRTFGRDLTTKEIAEIKKGDNAKFPIKGDVVPATTKATNKRESKGAAKPTEEKGNAREGKTKSRKRKQPEEESSSEEETLPQVRPHKRTRQGRRENSIAAEIGDLVMFEESPTIIDQEDDDRRYLLRSNRKASNRTKGAKQAAELSGERSTDNDSERATTHGYEPRKTRKGANAHRGSRRVHRTLRESSSEDEGDYIPTWVEGGENSHSESDEEDPVTQRSSVETDDEESMAQRNPFRRLPGAGDVGGKNKGPSWEEDHQSIEARDYRKAVVPLTMSGRTHYATYEGLISQGPIPPAGPSVTIPQPQVPDGVDTSLDQNESGPAQPHPFVSMMNEPFPDERNLEEEDTPLQAHRKRVREFLGDEEAEANAPPSKRLRTEQPVLPLERTPTQEATSNVPPQVVPPLVNTPLVNQRRLARPGSQARSSEATKQRLDAEQAEVFGQIFVDRGLSANYSEVPPSNNEEIRSLIDALLPTREVYFAWTGEAAPRTDPQQSYRAQFGTILGALEGWWKEHRPREPLPILAGVVHLGRSVDNWEPPSKDSIYYEAFEKGYRAQRGDLPNWSGPMLEDALRMGY